MYKFKSGIYKINHYDDSFIFKIHKNDINKPILPGSYIISEVYNINSDMDKSFEVAFIKNNYVKMFRYCLCEFNLAYKVGIFWKLLNGKEVEFYNLEFIK